MASDLVISVEDGTFDNEVLQSEVPVLVDFWAEWCGPCKMISPILDDIAPNYAGKLKIAKIDIDKSQTIPAKYGVRGIPTLILFENGEVKGTKVGALSRTQLTAFLDSYI